IEFHAVFAYLLSCPTRRSSDLIMYKEGDKSWSLSDTGHMLTERGITSHTGNGLLTRSSQNESNGLQVFIGTEHLLRIREKDGSRSEEHTSELQSRFDLVCRLLL